MSSISTTAEGTASQNSLWQKDIHKVNTSIQTTNSPVTSITSMAIVPTSLRNPSIQIELEIIPKIHKASQEDTTIVIRTSQEDIPTVIKTNQKDTATVLETNEE